MRPNHHTCTRNLADLQGHFVDIVKFQGMLAWFAVAGDYGSHAVLSCTAIEQPLLLLCPIKSHQLTNTKRHLASMLQWCKKPVVPASESNHICLMFHLFRMGGMFLIRRSCLSLMGDDVFSEGFWSGLIAEPTSHLPVFPFQCQFRFMHPYSA